MDVRSEIHVQLQRAVVEERERYDFPCCILHVVAPRVGLSDTFAAGYRDLESGTAITGPECFRIASITKTFTAASILRLVEAGRIDLDMPIASTLPEGFAAVLRDRGYGPDRVNVRQVLQHTSGLRESDGFVDTFGLDPKKRWTPLEHLRAAVHPEGPLTAPCKAFLYCDAGYTLLGRMVERETQLPQAEAYRSLLRFHTIGLTQTWFETLEAPPPNAPPQAHQYARGRDFSGVDPSFDLYGGGGLLSTGPDLTRFFRALLAGKVFDDPTTLALMLDVPDLPSPRRYGLGIQQNVVEGFQMWGHRGAWGSSCFHAPDIDMTFAFTRNTADVYEGYDEFGIIALLVRLIT
jgi:D-alanyl-D-alanine carboxypeptidase